MLRSSVKSSRLTTCVWNGILLNSKNPHECLRKWLKIPCASRDTISCNAAIAAHLSLSNFKEACQLLDEMGASKAEGMANSNLGGFFEDSNHFLADSSAFPDSDSSMSSSTVLDSSNSITLSQSSFNSNTLSQSTSSSSNSPLSCFNSFVSCSPAAVQKSLSAKCTPNHETFCLILDKFTRYKSMRRIVRTLLNLAISKYQLPWCESFAFYECMVQIAFEHVDTAVESYRKIYIYTNKPKRDYFERLLIVLGKCASDSKIGQVEKFGEFLEVVLADAIRLKVYVSSETWFKLLYFIACLPSESNRRTIQVIWTQKIASNAQVDEGLLVKLLYFQAKIKNLQMTKEIFNKLVRLVGFEQIQKHHIYPLLQFGKELGEEQFNFLEQWYERSE
jgi:pentatricopeptide repeat protein